MANTWTPEKKQAMENAAAAAIEEFEANMKTTKAGTLQSPSGQWIIDWLARWKNTAGYRRLCRFLITMTSPSQE